ncbi:MAG: FAD-dependent oxidoreductase [Propionibacteriales bacterium]|nr:FAD-dependent oxidoreductase [Propionibacteriales bacterium]
MGSAVTYHGLSLWHETAGDLHPRPALAEPTDVDVGIVGAGFTGLWTAYYLKQRVPSLRVAVVEKDIAGFGASGRNGGWMSALFPSSARAVAGFPGSSRDAALRQEQAMRDSIDEIERVVTRERIDCDFHRGGTIVFARTSAQLARARAMVQEARAWGQTEADLRLLSAGETAGYARASGVLGATYTPHCARVQPARLASGLAHTVERLGVDIFEQTPVTRIEPNRLSTPGAALRASHIVVATEGFSASIPGAAHRHPVIPVYSLIVATEPLPPRVLDQIGLDDYPTFSDHRHLIIYGQRTADDRIVFGGRGAPYHFGSAVQPAFDRDERVFAGLREALVDLFPPLRDSAFTHSWGGPIGIPRDWMASVGLDPVTRLAWGGGYVGDGVTTTNLAGRTLADLITGTESSLTTLPWVNHRSRRWEPEPLRWLGVNAGLRAMTVADAEERVTGSQSVIARAMSPMLGGHL